MQGYNGELWFLEGDEMVWVDGAGEPVMYGTGTEDYFTSGWYFNEGICAGPLHGLIIKDEEQARIAAYRYHLGDAIPFRESIRFTIEHGHANTEVGDYASTAYWYQMEPHAPFPKMPPGNARLPLRVLVPAGAREAETLDMLISNHGESVTIEDTRPFGADWQRGTHLRLDLAETGNVAWMLPVTALDRYLVALYLTEGPGYGSVRFSVDDVPLGGVIDLDGLEVAPSGRIELGEVRLEEGTVHLEVESVGPDPESGGRLFGLDAVSIEPVMNFVTRWQVIGPFDNPGQEGSELTTGLNIPYPPEGGIDLSATYEGMNGQEVDWRLVETDEDGYVNLDALYTPNELSCAYGAVWIESPDDREVDCLLGSDDWVGLWLNGERIHAHVLHRPAEPDQDRVRLRLKRGVNELLIKVGDDYGGWGYYLRIPDPDGVLVIRSAP